MILQYLQNLQFSIHEDNKKRGFWEQGLERNKGECVMLMITELAEAVEAHRKGRIFNSKFILDSIMIILNRNDCSTIDFETYVKNTVEDEIADAVIRILDYCVGFNVPLLERDYRKESTGNFSHDVLRLTHYCLSAYHSDTEQYTGKDWGYVLAAIIKFCEWYNIDLIQHVHWKLRYNNTRSYKHGKKY